MQEETEKAIEHLSANLDTLTGDNSTELEKGVALKQAVHNAESALESFKKNH